MSSPTNTRKFAVVSSRSTTRSTTVQTTRRKINPLFEGCSPKRVLVITTLDKTLLHNYQGAQVITNLFFAPRQLFPDNIASIIHEYVNTHPSPKEENDDKAPWHVRHVLLPFNLRDLKIDIFGGEACSLLYDIFPGTTNVTEARYRSHLLFQVKKLPSGPWPLTVGNVPITILAEGSQGRAFMFPQQNLGNLSISICEEYPIDKFSDRLLRELAASVESEFRNKMPKIQIIEIMFTCERTFYIVLHDNIIMSFIRANLPGRIANCPVGYIYDRDLHRPSWTVPLPVRHIQSEPREGIFDNTIYDALRPGVMICSQMLAEDGRLTVFSTTSGVLVGNTVDSRYMVGASHGIGEGAHVWQVTQKDRIIGHVVMDIPFTDISLLGLCDDIVYENETFEDSSGAAPTFVRLATSEDIFNWPLCHLNSPYIGKMEGSEVMKSVKLEATSTDPAENESRYIVYNWNYMGQEEGNEYKVRPPSGTSGSTIWNDDGIILGFYHYYIGEGQWMGFSRSVSASEVVEAGYNLVKLPEQQQ
ncbi:uncharacterized protein GGS22DRAFT_52995 [Annulohypoxylon maeteangense]|uniref:uncharacterized protein n=1 Tax=Annulohypoxylon maeteangense TaxID=1927788 RepID=UPI002008B02E|nr:uncharacterized protein GGS22DRAFT_52995 [Annulohypoxylon maeteangense]KAI0881966.1 hypothetical protein GGS22DRAFT_52995 [Annulohypoxylon maeteangense]